MNQWTNQKIIAAAISGMSIAAVVTVVTNARQAVALPSATVNQMVKQSTVRIDGVANGSGVIFAKNYAGYVVLTNQHVVEASGDYQVTTTDGRSYAVTDIQELQGSDLALVYFNSDRQYTIVARGDSDTLIEGQTLHIAGYPGSQNVASNRTYRFMSESLIGFLAPADVKDGYELIYSGAAIPGMSGSPIVNEEGQLVGVYGLTDIDINTGASYLYGIPLDTALKIATRSGIELSETQIEKNTGNSVFGENFSSDEPNPFGCWEDEKPVDCPLESDSAAIETEKSGVLEVLDGINQALKEECSNGGADWLNCPPESNTNSSNIETEKSNFAPQSDDFAPPEKPSSDFNSSDFWVPSK